MKESSHRQDFMMSSVCLKKESFLYYIQENEFQNRQRIISINPFVKKLLPLTPPPPLKNQLQAPFILYSYAQNTI